MGDTTDRSTLKIGELAQRLGLNVRTLRYYESIGLLPPAPRTEGGYRLYTETDERRLRFVLRAKQVGLSLEEIGRILELRRHGSACNYVRETLAAHVEAIDRQMAELSDLRASLIEVMSRQQAETLSDSQVCTLIEQSAPTQQATKEIPMNVSGRSVEVFTAGCPICDPVVELVQRVACPSCQVTVHSVKDDSGAAERAKAAGVTRVPMVLVDGKPLECCETGPVTEAALRAAGVGSA